VGGSGEQVQPDAREGHTPHGVESASMPWHRRALTLLLTAAIVLAAPLARPDPPRVLMLTYSAGYEHEVVRRPAAGTLSTAERVVVDLAHRSGRFEVEHVATREALGRLTAASVREHRVLLFFTTGELPIAPEVRQAMLQTVRDGGGFVGLHSATDTWYTVPEYQQLIGAVFDGHPWHRSVRLLVEDPTHPATRHLGTAFEIADEIYQFRDWSRERAHVLLRLDPRSVDVAQGKRADNDYALSWTRSYGRGRVFYTALGHEPAVWADPRFQAHVLGAIEWALDEATAPAVIGR